MQKNSLYEILDKEVINFFPEIGNVNNACFRSLMELNIEFFPYPSNVNSNCFKRPNEIKIDFFPCHTRDIQWLAAMFKNKYKLSNLSNSFIEEYIKQSEIFNKERHDYEQRVVEWQIKHILYYGENCVVDEKFGDALILLKESDIAFRKCAVDTLLFIGINYDSIEEGIEKNANIWRNWYMSMAYINTYGPYSMNSIDDPNQSDPEKNKKFKLNWTKMHLYEYYKMHKESVDKYGEILPEMQMADEEFKELNNCLVTESKERLQYIENYYKNKEQKFRSICYRKS